MTKKKSPKDCYKPKQSSYRGRNFSLEKVPRQATCAPKESRIHYLEGMTLDTFSFSFFHSTANIYIPPSLWILQRLTRGTHRPSFPYSWFLAFSGLNLACLKGAQGLPVFILTWDDELPASQVELLVTVLGVWLQDCPGVMPWCMLSPKQLFWVEHLGTKLDAAAMLMNCDA